MKSLSDFGSLRISVVAPVIALYGLVEITEQAKLMFLRGIQEISVEYS